MKKRSGCFWLPFPWSWSPAAAATTTSRPPRSITRPCRGCQADTRSVDYKCENGRKFTVQYLNKGDNSLAVVPVSDNSTLVFSNVISASGAKYAAGQYIWWTKGEEATLYGDWKGGEPTDGVACKER